jgi:hypothetical protein
MDPIRSKIIAVDFDNTLVKQQFSGEILPIKGACEALKLLKKKNYHIVIFTCRTNLADQRGELSSEIEAIAATLEEFKIPYDEIHVGEKVVADAYVDDRAVSFSGDWTQTLSDIELLLGKK